jgi:hypothetical protein
MKFIVSAKLLRLDGKRLADAEFEIDAHDWFDALARADAFARDAETHQTAVVYYVRPALS